MDSHSLIVYKIKSLWKGIAAAHKKGLTLEEIKASKPKELK